MAFAKAPRLSAHALGLPVGQGLVDLEVRASILLESDLGEGRPLSLTSSESGARVGMFAVRVIDWEICRLSSKASSEAEMLGTIGPASANRLLLLLNLFAIGSSTGPEAALFGALIVSAMTIDYSGRQMGNRDMAADYIYRSRKVVFVE